MEKLEILSAGDVDHAFSIINNDFIANPDFLNYQKTIDIGGKVVEVYIDIDLGGGFEGGYAMTNIKSKLLDEPTFRFALHHESFIDEVGKFLGMEDVEIGYPEFDKKVITKTDDPLAIHSFFEDQESRIVFGRLKNFNLSISHHHDDNDLKQPYLEFEMEDALNSAELLRPVFHAFCKILKQIKFIK